MIAIVYGKSLGDSCWDTKSSQKAVSQHISKQWSVDERGPECVKKRTLSNGGLDHCKPDPYNE